MNQKSAPLWDALQDYAEKGVIPFHTPGHKLQPGPFSRLEAALGSGIFALDPSDEIESLFYGHNFESALGAAQALAAELFEAENSMFLVNGTTGGLHYLLASLTGSVFIPRFSHQAVYSGLILSDAQAVYLPADYHSEWLIPLPPKVWQLKELFFRENGQALVLTSPSYYGGVPELSEAISAAKERDLLVFVDEAHGGHFLFSPELPLTALQCGADAVVQSTHKTLGSFTQTSMLHSNNGECFERALDAQRILQTSSPSLMFLASLDEIRRTLALEGKQLVAGAVELARDCATRLGRLPYVQVLPEPLNADPTKIVFSLREMGLTGLEVEAILRSDYNIQVEFSDYYNVLGLITLGDTASKVDRLVQAVQDLTGPRHTLLRKKRLPLRKIHFPKLPPAIYTLRDGFLREKEYVSLERCAGRICGSFVAPYPPGVPVIAPGELFTQEIVEYLSWCLAIGWQVRGIRVGETVAVIKDNESF